MLSNPGVWREGDNPFLKLLFDELSSKIDLDAFTWRKALLGHYDILHIHWLEYVLRGPTLPITAVKRALFLLLIVRLRATRTPSVWTVHNESPHDGTTRIERVLLGAWARQVTHKVLLTATSTWAADRDASVIPHGHYRPTLQGPDAPRQPRPEVRFLLFGHLRPYKGVEHLIEVVGAMQDEPAGPPLTLSIVGRAARPEYAQSLRTLSAPHPGIRLTTAFLDDAALEQEIYRADCVVLPYRRMVNSGAALLALSCGRPILVPDSPSMLELQAEVGSRWVQTFSPPLSATDLRATIEAITDAGSEGGPDLSRRHWPVIAEQYVEVYRALRSDRRTGGEDAGPRRSPAV